MHSQHARWFSRRRFLGGVTLAGTVGLLGLCPRLGAAEPPPETTRLRLGWAPGAFCSAPYYLAEAFLSGEGFTEVQWVDIRASSQLKATASGEIDFGSNFIGPTLTRVDAGDPPRLLRAVCARAGPHHPRLEGQDNGGARAGQH
jgi:NitT/TauT family transport system substrate-binding protein